MLDDDKDSLTFRFNHVDQKCTYMGDISHFNSGRLSKQELASRWWSFYALTGEGWDKVDVW
jgi:hypothetical protein